jgi:hypothetical protein
MLRKLIAVAAWASLAVIAFATLLPVRIVYLGYEALKSTGAQPAITTYIHIEHAAAFAIVGALFCMAYPKRIFLVCFLVLGAAALLEILQMLTPDRHGRLPDALEKMASGAIGIMGTKIILLFLDAAEAGRSRRESPS